jgi:hypothetical protein
MIEAFQRLFQRLIRTRLGLLGAVLTTSSAILIIAVLLLSLLGFETSPYLGVLAFLILPGLFVLGLLLMPLGSWLERRRQLRGGGDASLPVFDLNVPAMRRRLLVFAGLTVANLVIIGAASYKGVEVMDRAQFCGSCHSVMDPEFTAYSRSPHSRVACVQCHIGPGASWFVKSKLSGAWQVVSVSLNLYPRPIPTPVKNLRPSRDTCEQCHWPTRFVGDRLRVLTRHEEDEKNTPKNTVLLMHVGGGDAGHGIHRHVAPGVQIRYLADPKRETIATVELTDKYGEVHRFEPKPPEGKPAPSTEGMVWRTMDCVDCHNRPTHQYRSAEFEIDAAIQDGRIDRSLPFIRREGLKALKTEFPSADAAKAGISKALTEFYEKQFPDLLKERRGSVEKAARELAEAWRVNVWPQMNITWGTYPSHLGHPNPNGPEVPGASNGCWRCHDDNHVTADGKSISQDCDLCHAVLANDEEKPEVLKQMGLVKDETPKDDGKKDAQPAKAN